MLGYEIEIKEFQEINDWGLFADCYSSVYKIKRSSVMRMLKEKYYTNEGFIALMYTNGKVCASYSVIKCIVKDKLVGLSVDTMSNGDIKHATSKLTDQLYPRLKKQGYSGLLGFPNQNILSLRLEHLGWEYIDTYYPVLSRNKNYPLMWKINRPTGLFFKDSLHKFVLSKLLELNICSLVLKKPVMNRRPIMALGPPKILCRKVFQNNFPEINFPDILPLNSIDVP